MNGVHAAPGCHQPGLHCGPDRHPHPRAPRRVRRQRDAHLHGSGHQPGAGPGAQQRAGFHRPGGHQQHDDRARAPWPACAAIAGNSEEVLLIWQAPESGGQVESYEYRHAQGSTVPPETAWSDAGTTTRFLVTPLDQRPAPRLRGAGQEPVRHRPGRVSDPDAGRHPAARRVALPRGPDGPGEGRMLP